MYRFIVIFFLFITNNIYSQASSINGVIKVIDKATNTPKAGAVVIVKEANSYLTTDSNGIAKFIVPSGGFYTFRVMSGSSVEVRKKEILYNGQEVSVFIGELERGVIEVTGEKEKSKLSRFTLNQEEIKRLPGVQGDSLKAILTLPGVAPALPVGLLPSAAFARTLLDGVYSNSDRGEIVLRGSGSRQNLFYFDGFPVSYPFHLGNQSSVFNNNIIKSFDVYTGAYSTRYGFATGGIINIEGKSEVKKTGAVINMNTFQSDALLETKLFTKGYMIAGARKNYPNVIFLKIYPDAIPPDAKYANYEDYQFKIGYDINDRHKLLFITFGTRDRQAYTKTQSEFESGGESGPVDNRPPVGLDKRFRTDGFRYIYKPGSKFTNTFNISVNSFKEFYELKFQNPLTSENIFGLQNVTTQKLFYVENLQSFEIWKNFIRLDTGQNYRTKEINLKAENISQQNSQFSKVFNDLLDSSPTFRALIDGDGAKTKEIGAFAELNMEYRGFKFIPGARWDYYNLGDQKAVSPRANISYTIDKTGTTFIGGAGIHRNSPVGIEQISFKAGNPNLIMEKSEHTAIGINQEFGSKYIAKLEGFRNIYKDIVVPDDYVTNPYALNDEPRDILQKGDFVTRNPIVNKSRFYSNNGDGFSEGVEIFLKKNLKPGEFGWFGWISYSNSITKRNNHLTRFNSKENSDRNIAKNSHKLLYQTQIDKSYINYYDDNKIEVLFDNDRPELYDLDRRHILSVVFGWKINRDWQIGGRFRYFTNTPITPINGSTRVNQAATFGINLNNPEYSSRFNSERLPEFHQLDIRIDRFNNYEWGYTNFYIEFVNFYGKRNVSGMQFDNFRPYIPSTNPKPVYDTLNSPYIQTPLPGGHLLFLPLITIGMEVRF